MTPEELFRRLVIYFVTYEESSFSILIKRINSRVQLDTLIFFIHISFYTKQLLEIDPSQLCDCTVDFFSSLLSLFPPIPVIKLALPGSVYHYFVMTKCLT